MRLSNKYGGLQFFAGAPALDDVVINFDSHISKVVLTSSDYDSGKEWTTSGQAVFMGATDGQVGLFTVTLESGYVIDTVSFSADYATLDEKTDTTFTLTNGSGVWASPITITSKLGGGECNE